ncbi:sporulation integral membrane protein YtvI [Ammoniphilus sp. CFH 90114]|uniref:sporulation integral membrane protein YtvI n=1 Tax=Ammoniphilus sp. CFH 90114 TaxID=2493665 RepID=UPI00100DF670|nr:sporulation integral membrane protein YtvI [Ammoniphilus sp. CFH 90114]RXT08818.1 sporulation integral membrane protein YtvI [Ammoniphilus sp. CFH 90114]
MSIRKLILPLLIGVLGLILVLHGIPLVLALITAILLEPIIQLMIRVFNMKRMPAVTITYILFLASFGMGSYWLSTLLVVQSVELAHKLPMLSAHFFETLERYIIVWEKYYALLPVETISTIQQVLNSLKNSAMIAASTVTKWIFNIVAALPELLLISIVYLISLFLISFDLPSLRNGFMNLFTPSAKEKVDLVLNQLSRALVGFLGAQIILSLMTYLLALIGLLILDVKYAFLIAFIIVLVDILPILGTGSFIVPWAAYQFFINNDQFLAVGLIILFLVITVVRRIVEPKILGESLGISALAALASLYIGFQLLGFVGFILGPAIVIIIEALLKAGFLKVKLDF